MLSPYSRYHACATVVANRACAKVVVRGFQTDVVLVENGNRKSKYIKQHGDYKSNIKVILLHCALIRFV